MIEQGNFLCAGYASTRGYASKSKLRVPVFAVFSRFRQLTYSVITNLN